MLNLNLKNNNLKVSIITATYNSEKTISTCLNSIVSQNYSEIECIVIDGKSSDSTLQIIEKFQSKYKFIKVFSEADNGIYDALNKGIFKASGSIVGFVHSDDFLLTNVMEFTVMFYMSVLIILIRLQDIGKVNLLILN